MAELHQRLIQIAKESFDLCLKLAIKIRAFILVGHELVEPTALARIGCGVVFLQLSQFCCLFDSVVKTAQLIHELDVEGIGSEPYTTLRDGIDLCGLHATSLRYDIEE